MEDLKIIQVNNIDENETILWQEDGSFSFEIQKTDIVIFSILFILFILIMFILAAICYVSANEEFAFYHQGEIQVCIVIALTIFVFCVMFSAYIIEQKDKKAEENKIRNMVKEFVPSFYVITDKAVYCRIANGQKKYQKFFFIDIDTIYTDTSDTSISLGRYKDCAEEDMSLKNVKDYNTALNLIKEKTGIEPELVDM